MSDCENCVIHGFPCLNCAEHLYQGKIGPGFYKGERLLLKSTPKNIRKNMINWQDDRLIYWIIFYFLLVCILMQFVSIFLYK